MNKKNIIQLFLLLLICGVFLITFNLYFAPKDQEEVEIKKIEDKKELSIKVVPNTPILTTVSSNLMEDIEYISSDSRGNEYKIIAKRGEIDLNNLDIIFMTDVRAIIKFENGTIIFINSDFAKYNIKNYETNFTENVIAESENHKISGQNLDLSFEKNLLAMFNDINYEYLDTKLKADRIEIDLITKNSKILMDDVSKKVEIISIQ